MTWPWGDPCTQLFAAIESVVLLALTESVNVRSFSFRTMDQFLDGNKFPPGIKHISHPWPLIGLDIEFSSRSVRDITSGCTSKPFNLLRHVCPTLVQTSSEVPSFLPPFLHARSHTVRIVCLDGGGHSGHSYCDSATHPQMTMRSMVNIPAR